MTANPLVDARDLARELGRADWIVVDCRFTLTDPKAGRAAYDRGHIPGSRYAHLDDDLSRPPRANEGRHPLPDRDRFAATLGAWGVGPGDTVVAYDEGSGAIAARLWWMLGWLGHERRAVLDGGFAALGVEATQGEAMSATNPSPSNGSDGQENAPQLVSIAEIARMLGVEVRHVRRLVFERRIPFYKWGHLLRFDPVEVLEWLRQHQYRPRKGA